MNTNKEFSQRDSRGKNIKKLVHRNTTQAINWAYGDKAPMVERRLVLEVKDWENDVPSPYESFATRHARKVGMHRTKVIREYVERHKGATGYKVITEQGRDERYTRYEIVNLKRAK